MRVKKKFDDVYALNWFIKKKLKKNQRTFSAYRNIVEFLCLRYSDKVVLIYNTVYLDYLFKKSKFKEESLFFAKVNYNSWKASYKKYYLHEDFSKITFEYPSPHAVDSFAVEEIYPYIKDIKV